MDNVLYISLVGITPLAVANSIYYNIKEYKKLMGQYSILFIKSETTTLEGNFILRLLEKYKKEYALSKWMTLPKKTKELIVSEIDILDISSKIHQYLISIEDLYDKFILDITGGRKAMSAGLFFAFLKNKQNFNHKNPEVRYYLLKDFSRTNTREGPELFPDEYEIKKWTISEFGKWINE